MAPNPIDVRFCANAPDAALPALGLINGGGRGSKKKPCTSLYLTPLVQDLTFTREGSMLAERIQSMNRCRARQVCMIHDEDVGSSDVPLR